MMRISAVELAAGAFVLAIAAFPRLGLALDHANLDGGRPVRFEDPYPIPRGEWSFELGGGVRDNEVLGSHSFFPVEILFGAALNAQIKVSTEFAAREDSTHAESLRIGDTRVSGLYNFTQETTSVPGLGFEYAVLLPTGRDSHGLDAQVKLLITKSISRLSFHANASELFVGERSPGERYSRFELDFGTSFPLAGGTRTLVLLGGYVEQSPFRTVEGPGGIQLGRNRVGLELGFRRQQTARTVFDIGVATETEGDAKDQIRANAGISWSY
jgi:hypothetical protein